MKIFRNTGAKGALLDEYEKAINELLEVIQDVTQDELQAIVDPNTLDRNCLSIQTILSHVISAGTNYAIVVRKFSGEMIEYKSPHHLNSAQEYREAIQKMFIFNENLFIDYPDLVLEEHDASKKILVRWGQLYDVEQLFEHAIVHILRHRRQIERFLMILRSNKY